MKARDTTWERSLSDIRSALRGHWGRVENPVTVKRMWHKEWELEYLEVTTAKMQYSAYRNDGSLDYQFLNSNKRPDMFFHQLSKVPEYSQFGLLSLTLL